MVRNQSPGETVRLGFFQQGAESFYEVVPVGVIFKYIVAINTPGNNVMEGPGGPDSPSKK